MTVRSDLFAILAAGLRGDTARLSELERERADRLAKLDAEIVRLRWLRACWHIIAEHERCARGEPQ